MKRLLVVVSPSGVNNSVLSACLSQWHGKISSTVATSVASPLRLNSDKSTTIDIGKIRIGGYDGILMLGDPGSRKHLWHNAALISVLQRFDKKKKLVAGLGIGTVILAQAGILMGKPATTKQTSEYLEMLESYGAIVRADDIVRFTWLLTSSGERIDDFANVLCDMLQPEISRY
jgi:protease I